MPKTLNQAVAVAVIGGLALLTGSIAKNVSGQRSGIPGFAVGVVGAGIGAGLGLMALSGTGAKLV